MGVKTMSMSWRMASKVSKELLGVAWCVKFINNIYLGLRDLLEKFRIGRTETPDNAMIN